MRAETLVLNLAMKVWFFALNFSPRVEILVLNLILKFKSSVLYSLLRGKTVV